MEVLLKSLEYLINKNESLRVKLDWYRVGDLVECKYGRGDLILIRRCEIGNKMWHCYLINDGGFTIEYEWSFGKIK